MASPTRPIRSGKTTAVQLLLLALMEVGILIGVVHSCISGEQEALMKFKQGAEDPYDRLGSWIAGTNCCSWKGIGCDGRTGRVIVLDLRNNSNRTKSLGGEIDPSLCYLKHIQYLDMSLNNFDVNNLNFIDCFQGLRYLNLSDNFFEKMLSLQEVDISFNNFGGSIPTSLGKSSSLRLLSLKANNFSGSISDDYFEEMKSLTELDISENYLSGSLPTSLGKLLALQSLSLGTNNFIGLLPASLGNLHLLEHLDLSSNDFSGIIPDFLGNLQSLTELFLFYNNFSGTIPDFLGNLQLLRDLDLSDNSLSGLIPTSIWTLRSLEELGLYGNNFEGNVPESVCELSSLEEFYLLGNENMKGTLPHCIGQLRELQILVIGGENFEIALNESHFANMTNLKYLEIRSAKSLVMNFSSDWIPPFRLESLFIYSTKIGSEFPMWIRTQNTLFDLMLTNTSIYGNLPTWIWDFSDTLESIDLSNNNMSGELPDPKPSKRLQGLDLSSNKFRGSTWLNTISEMMPALGSLSLLQNDFSGNIPISLCKLIFLYILELSENNFCGEIPNCLMHVFILSLANNNLHGKLPSPVENQNCGMHILRLASNELSGTLPPSWKDCLNMVFLDLGRNKLSGDIPIWLTEGMPFLQVLRLRENKFSENVPQDMGLPTWIWDFSDTLDYIGLSNNNMSGELPYPKHPKRLKDLDLSSNKFRGSTWLNTISEMMPALLTLSLAQNDFSGNIPISLCKLIFLYILELSENNFCGEIPNCLMHVFILSLANNNLHGKLPSPVENQNCGMHILRLASNELSGTLPPSWKDCLNMVFLDLGRNKLSGDIPIWLTEGMPFLQVLRLRENKFSENVPQELSELGALQVLDSGYFMGY